MRLSVLALVLLMAAAPGWPQAQNRGYYRFPAIYGPTIVFTAEGDLWAVGIEGGTARRLTTHPGEEMHAAFSPDGKTIAFSANYEGPTEVYTMPATGGLPSRRTFEGNANVVAGPPTERFSIPRGGTRRCPRPNWPPSIRRTAWNWFR